MNEIIFRDTDIYQTQAEYVKVLKSNNIITIADLLDVNKMNKILTRCGDDVRGELQSLIPLLKFKYFGTIMPNVSLIDKYLTNDMHQLKIEFNPGVYLLFESSSFLAIKKSSAYAIENRFIREELSKSGRVKLIDYLNWIIKTSETGYYPSVAAIAKLYIDAYNKQNNITNEEELGDDEIIELKKQLKEIIKTRDTLNKQIESLSVNIEGLINRNLGK